MTHKPTLPNSPNTQQGMALITVLMVILLLSLVGAIVVRNSQVSQNISTASQVKNLLRQSSDVPLAKLQRSNIETDGKQTYLQKMSDFEAPIGYLRVNGSQFKNVEYVVCYQPTQSDNLYQGANEHRVIGSADGKTVYKASNGYCRLTTLVDKEKYYTSGRGTVATQIAFTAPNINNTNSDDADQRTVVDSNGNRTQENAQTNMPFMGMEGGTDCVSANCGERLYLRVHSTSVTPVLATTSSNKQVDDCLKLPVGGLAGDNQKTNQRLCLDNTDTPMNIQVQDYIYINKPSN